MTRQEMLERQRNISQELYSVCLNIKFLIKDGAIQELFRELEIAFKEHGIGVIGKDGLVSPEDVKFYLSMTEEEQKNG